MGRSRLAVLAVGVSRVSLYQDDWVGGGSGPNHRCPTGLPGRRSVRSQFIGSWESTPVTSGPADDPTIKDASTMRHAYVRGQLRLVGCFAELLYHTVSGTSSEPPTGDRARYP